MRETALCTVASSEGAPDAPDLQRLYEEHAPFVHSLLEGLLGSRAEADDLTQEVFLVALRKLRSGRGSFRVQSPRPWLGQIALRLASNARRLVRARRVLGLSAAGEAWDWRTPETAVEAQDDARAIYAALETLTEKRRTVFILYEIEGLTGQEIAELTGCPLHTVHTRLFHARRDFVARLQAARQEESRRIERSAGGGSR